MTLDDAIKHAEEVAEEQEKAAKEWHENQVRKCELFPFVEMDYTHENECKKCADEHRQLAEWLKDYKRLIEQQSCDDCVSRAELLKKYEDRFIELQRAHQQDKQLGVNWCINTLKEMPPVTPTHGTCKDCTNYVVGALDEEICIRGHELTHKDFYCADFEKRDNNKPKTYIDCQKCEYFRNPDYSRCIKCEKRGDEK